ncbi:hypothetical protein HK096_009425, partial [Nowakowskiella sp. JEL0078]
MVSKISVPQRSLLGLAICLSLCVTPSSAQTCSSYPNTVNQSNPVSGICKGIISYNIYIPENASISLLESSLSNLTALAALKSTYPECTNAYAAWACSVTFPLCASSNFTVPAFELPCKSLCENARSACTAPFTALSKQALLPDCSVIQRFKTAYPTADCIDPTIVGNWTYSTSSSTNTNTNSSSSLSENCPYPFVTASTDDFAKMDEAAKSKCFGSCCIPCPFGNAFYPQGSMDLTNNITEYVRWVSTALTFLILVSYIMLPGYQTQPRDLILFVTL